MGSVIRGMATNLGVGHGGWGHLGVGVVGGCCRGGVAKVVARCRVAKI